MWRAAAASPSIFSVLLGHQFVLLHQKYGRGIEYAIYDCDKNEDEYFPFIGGNMLTKIIIIRVKYLHCIWWYVALARPRLTVTFPSHDATERKEQRTREGKDDEPPNCCVWEVLICHRIIYIQICSSITSGRRTLRFINSIQARVLLAVIKRCDPRKGTASTVIPDRRRSYRDWLTIVQVRMRVSNESFEFNGTLHVPFVASLAIHLRAHLLYSTLPSSVWLSDVSCLVGSIALKCSSFGELTFHRPHLILIHQHYNGKLNLRPLWFPNYPPDAWNRNRSSSLCALLWSSNRHFIGGLSHLLWNTVARLVNLYLAGLLCKFAWQSIHLFMHFWSVPR